ncbi:SymE family type I addiction module toxin [Enterocloster clostridioformis]|uniref:SymE family type I addiction module toxin n=1 Tax=Enterocloster clostridioformis TaxID=1531 RepID=UPI0009B793A9
MYKKLKVYEGRQRNYKSVPKIILSGQWLEAIGFSIGNQIEVEYSDDKIIVTKVTEVEENTNGKCKG